MKTERCATGSASAFGRRVDIFRSQTLTGTRFGTSGMHDSVGPDLLVLRRHDYGWLRAPGMSSTQSSRIPLPVFRRLNEIRTHRNAG